MQIVDISEIISGVLDFLNIFDKTHYIRLNYQKLIDKNEYLGNRIVSFIVILLSIIAIVFFIFIIFIIFKTND